MTMKTHRRNTVVTSLAFALATVGFSANAAEVTGFVNGFDCATEGDKCPVDRLDPHLALEEDFVVQQADGEFVLIPNVPRDVKVRHVLKRVRVTGDMDSKYGSLKAEKFAVYNKAEDSFETVWSPELVERERQRELQESLQRQTGS